MPNQSDLAVLINAVVDDPDVKAMVKSLAMDALAEAQDMIRRGSPSVKQSVIRAVMPALVASLKESQVGDGLTDLRAKQNQLFGEIRDAQ